MYTTTLFDKPLILLMETHPKIACSDDVFYLWTATLIMVLIPIRVLSDKFEWQVTHEHAAKCYQLERILV